MKIQICLIAFFTVLFVNPIFAAEPYVVVVNSKNPVKSISVEQLKSYLYKQTKLWKTKTQVIPFDLNNKADRVGFHKYFFNMDEQQYEKYWKEFQLNSELRPPRKVKAEYLTSLVKVFNGGLGYFKRSDFQKDQAKGLRTLVVTGLKK